MWLRPGSPDTHDFGPYGLPRVADEFCVVVFCKYARWPFMGLEKAPWGKCTIVMLVLVALWIENVQATSSLWPNLFGPNPARPAIPETLSVQEGIDLVQKEGLESLALDIGGSLVKILVLQRGKPKDDLPEAPW
jgi:hypothetical protein